MVKRIKKSGQESKTLPPFGILSLRGWWLLWVDCGFTGDCCGSECRRQLWLVVVLARRRMGRRRREGGHEHSHIILWRRVNCNQCDYESSSAGNLRKHLKKCGEEMSQKCNQSNFASSRQTLTRCLIWLLRRDRDFVSFSLVPRDENEILFT